MAKKTGLGKGLESLMGEANAEVGSIAPETTLPISKVKPNEGQPRQNFDKEALDELAASIKQDGILQPIMVRKMGESYEIIAGERRYQAAKSIGLKEVPVIVREVSDEDVFRLALIENLQRSDLSPIEEAKGYARLIEQGGLTQEQLAKAVSKSRPAIANSLRLLELPEDIQTMVGEKTISAGHARALLAVQDEEQRSKLAQKIVAEGLSVRAAEALVPLYSKGQSEPPKRVPSPRSYKRAARRLRMLLDARVRVHSVRGKNKIEIEFEGEDDLERIIDVISGRG